MPDSLEILQKFRFLWRTSVKDAESFARALESNFPGKLKEFADVAKARQRRYQKRVLLVLIMPILMLASMIIREIYSRPEDNLGVNIGGGLFLFIIFTLFIVILVALLPDKNYQLTLAGITKDVPKDILKNVAKFQRRFEIDFSRRPFAVRRRRAYTGGDGGSGGGDVGGGGGDGGGG